MLPRVLQISVIQSDSVPVDALFLCPNSLMNTITGHNLDLFFPRCVSYSSDL